MLLHIPDVLTPEQLAQCRALLDDAARAAPPGMPPPEDSSTARQLGETLLAALNKNPLFTSAALPAKIFPPQFARHGIDLAEGNRVDPAFRQVRGTPHRVRADLSATLFFSEPEEYDGGELLIEDTYGSHSAKLPAGHLILYPASTPYRVAPITRGTRTVSFFWIQSLVREDAQRALLFSMDMAILQLRQRVGDTPEAVTLTGCYHNLLRRWAVP